MTWKAVVASLPCVVLGLPWLFIGLHLPEGPPALAWASTLIGLALVLSPLLAWHNSVGTRYVLTDRRAIVLEPGWFGRRAMDVYPVQEWKNLQFHRWRSGGGHVVFARFGMGATLGFKFLKDLSGVESLVRAMADRGRNPAM